MCDCYLVMVERLVSLSEPESYAGGRFTCISPGRATHARKVDVESPDQKGHEVGLWANHSLP